MMTDDQLNAELDRLSIDATGNNSTLKNITAELMDRYEGNPYGDEVYEKSSVISNDGMDLVESDMPSLARVFLGSGDIIRFKANNTKNEEDREEAERKTKYVDWQIREQPWSFPVLHGFIKNAEINKLSILKYFIEETTEVEEHKKTGLSNEELAAYQSTLEGEDVKSVEIVREEKNGDEENSVVFKVERTKKMVKLRNIPFENFRMTKNAESKDEADLVGDVDVTTRGELLAKGYSRELISSLQQIGDIESGTETKRIRNEDEGGNKEEGGSSSWASEQVEIEYLYPLIDFDEDGISERRYIVKSGDVILENEVFNHVPYAIMSAILMPHKAIGKSRVELVTQVAAAKTAILRGVNDNIYAVNSPRMAANEVVHHDDLLVIRPNGLIRSKGDAPPGNNLMPVEVPYIGDKALQVVQYWDQARAQTTGSLMASQGLDADRLSKETATRFEGIKDISQSKVELVARVMGETGFRQLYEGVAWLDANFQDSATEIEVLGEELEIDPREWKFKHQVKCKVGLGAGDDSHIMQTMSGFWAVHAELKADGSPITDEKKRFNVLKGLSKAAGISDESEYFNDPEKPEELLLAQNEQLTKAVMLLQEQVNAAQNPLAEAEQIKQQANLVKAQSDAQIQITKHYEDQRQFNIEMAQKQDQFMKDLAAQITEMQLKYNEELPEAKEIE